MCVFSFIVVIEVEVMEMSKRESREVDDGFRFRCFK